MQQIYCSRESTGRLEPRFHFTEITTSIDPAHSQVQSGKNRAAKETKRSPARPSPLPETASLSPTAAKTVKHHTASMMFTFSPGLQHRQPQNVTKSAGGEERKNPTGGDDGEAVERICYTSDAARPLIALSADALATFTSDRLK